VTAPTRVRVADVRDGEFARADLRTAADDGY
jgi:hypothetical protein